jgi:uncharacterized caspase-like protein
MECRQLGNWLSVVVAAVLAVWASAASAQKEIRVALVIGNGAYQNAEPLRNPVNDARAMARVLREVGFDVMLRENTTRRALTDTLREFSAKLSPGGVGLFYYAGHGMQVRGVNYLLPVDAALSNEDELRYETIDLNDVLNRFDDARTRLSLVILDACRDNPFARGFRSTSRGLAQTDAPRGTVIAYATAPGQTAADGDGANGLYTTELLKAIGEPGLKLEEVFKRTIDGVARASANRQLPWVSSSFRGEFYFHAAAVAAPSPPPPPVAAVPSPTSPEALELAAWNAISSSSNPVMFEVFLKRFPNGIYADFARARLEELKTAAAAEDAKRVAAAEEAKRKADADAAKEEARRVAAAEEAKRKADADAAKEEAKRAAAAEEAKRKADAEEAKRAAAAEEAKRRAAAEDEKKSFENAEIALKLADIDRRRIQAALTAKGFDTLGTDGSFGPRTRQMIGNWQRSRNEPSTGFLTATQAALLSQEGQTALGKVEDERKKADEEKRKTEDERKKADADRAKTAPPAVPATPAPAPAPAAASPQAVATAPAGPISPASLSGTFPGQVCWAAWMGFPAVCRDAAVTIANGAFSGRHGTPSMSSYQYVRGTLRPDGSASGKLDSVSNSYANQGAVHTIEIAGRIQGKTLAMSGVVHSVGRVVTLTVDLGR